MYRYILCMIRRSIAVLTHIITNQWLAMTEVEADEVDGAEPGSRSPDPTHAVAWVNIEFSVEEMRRMAVLTTLFLEKVGLRFWLG